MESSVGHNSVSHNKKTKQSAKKAQAPVDRSNSIRYAGGDVEGEHLDMTLFRDELTLKVAGHCEVYTQGNTLHRVTGKQDFVISDATLLARVQELKQRFDTGFEEAELKQSRRLALDIEKAPATWAGNA